MKFFLGAFTVIISTGILQNIYQALPRPNSSMIINDFSLAFYDETRSVFSKNAIGRSVYILPYPHIVGATRART